ncbi:hypothetical protein Tco_1510428, partial [Tanacetum coccineum]
NQETSSIKDKDFRNSDIKDLQSQTKKCSPGRLLALEAFFERLLASFHDDPKYEHVGQDTRSQGGNDDKDKKRKDLKISELKTKSKDNDKRLKTKDHKA